MWAIQQLICSTKKEELIIVYFLQEDAALLELIANIYTKCPRWKTVNVSIRPKTFLGGVDSARSEKI